MQKSKRTLKSDKYTLVSLFSGCGGLDYGFKEENFEILWANDKFNSACETYRENIGPHIICEDILKIDIADIPQADVVIGGPPCQGFSGIGKRNPNDKRSFLVWKYLDILKSVKPKVFLFENVPGIMSAKLPNGAKVIDNLKIAFKQIGYNIDLFILNSADYGVPQRRKRIFIIGNFFNINIQPPKRTHSEEGVKLKKWVSVSDAISDLPKPTNSGIVSINYSIKNDFLKFVRSGEKKINLHRPSRLSDKEKKMIKFIKPGENYNKIPDSIATKRILNFKKTGGRTTIFGRLKPNMPSYTLNTFFDKPGIGCNLHYSEYRTITLREGMRLQSFPDKFKFCSNNLRNYYVQVGNAVPVLLGVVWAKEIKRILINHK